MEDNNQFSCLLEKKHASNYPNDENAENMPTGKCETCGKQLDDQKFKKDKRFCSSICAKRYVIFFGLFL